MPISLQKGQKVDLTKGNPSLRHVLVGLGWDVNKYDGGFDFDLDASAFLLGANGQTPDTDAFCILWESQTFVRLCGAHGR